MMNTMLSQLPPDEPNGMLFLALYLQWLPAPLCERVAAKHFTDPQQLAKYADTLGGPAAAAYHCCCSSGGPAAYVDLSASWLFPGPLRF